MMHHQPAIVAAMGLIHQPVYEARAVLTCGRTVELRDKKNVRIHTVVALIEYESARTASTHAFGGKPARRHRAMVRCTLGAHALQAHVTGTPLSELLHTHTQTQHTTHTSASLG